MAYFLHAVCAGEGIVPACDVYYESFATDRYLHVWEVLLPYKLYDTSRRVVHHCSHNGWSNPIFTHPSHPSTYCRCRLFYLTLAHSIYSIIYSCVYKYTYIALEFYIHDLKKTQDRNYAEIFSCIALHCYYVLSGQCAAFGIVLFNTVSIFHLIIIILDAWKNR